MKKFIKRTSLMFVISVLLMGCSAKPLTQAEQAILENRRLVSETCEEFIRYSDALVINLNTPSQSLEVLRPIVKDFYSASEADQMNKDYREVYSVLDDNAEMMSEYLAYQIINPDYSPDEKDFKNFTDNLSVARIFCIDLAKSQSN
jgi:hypothetical protein